MHPALNSIFAVGYTLIMSGRMLLTAKSGDGQIRQQYGVQWARTLCRRCGVTLQCFGLEDVDFSQPVVVVANHQSYFDIPVLVLATGHMFSFLGKRELFHIPLFGAAIRRAGCVPIDRGDRAQARTSVAEAAAQVQSGLSVAVFPEGTRSHTDELLPFKKGAFYLAQRAGAPVLPIGIKGTRQILSKTGLLIRPGKVEVHVGKPLRCVADSEKARDDLRKKTRAAIAELIGARRRAPSL